MEQSRHSDIKKWTDQLNLAAHGEGRGTPNAQIGVIGVLKEFSDYFVPRIAACREAPQDDLVSLFVDAESNEVLSVTEVLMSVLTFLLAGNETTTSAIGNTVNLLLEHPDQLNLLAREPELASAELRRVSDLHRRSSRCSAKRYRVQTLAESPFPPAIPSSSFCPPRTATSQT